MDIIAIQEFIKDLFRVSGAVPFIYDEPWIMTYKPATLVCKNIYLYYTDILLVYIYMHI